ncbi:U32 family peptidase, partial [Lysinibacillus fusiformis]|uniref:U32 family peptidase n=1 Tax=Lysinibacillus fusiformis TaxID=28031 RepID=UPI0020BF7994
FSVEKEAEATKLIHAEGKKVYVAVNALFHNEKLEALADYLKEMQRMGVDRLIYGDPAVLIIRREQAVTIPLH